MFELTYLKNVSTLRLDREKCIGCKMCNIVCPRNVFIIKDKKSFIRDIDDCMECGACTTNCPSSAIIVKSGVGCATGVLNGMLKGTEPACDCGTGDGNSDNCCC